MAGAKVGAKALKPAEQVGPVLDTDKLAVRHGELVEMGVHQRQVLDQFGDGLPWHPEHYESAIRIEIGRSAESFLRAGRMLLVARTCCEHGEWSGMLHRLNLGDDTALHMMAWARQITGLANPERVRDLQAAATTIGKMIELSKLPPEQFKALAEEGQTGELELDDVASMTRDELRAAVREARNNADAKDQRITKLSEDLNREAEKTAKAQRKWKSAVPDERQRMLEHAVTDAEAALIANLGSLKSGLQAAVVSLAEFCDSNELSCDAFLGDVFGRLLNAVRRVRDDEDLPFAIPLVNDGDA